MDPAVLLALLNILPGLAVPVANLIRDLLTNNGYDIDKLLSAGASLNEQTLTHVQMEINRVTNKLLLEEANNAKAQALASKGGDPVSTSTPVVEVPKENFLPPIAGTPITDEESFETLHETPPVENLTGAPLKPGVTGTFKVVDKK